MSCNVGSRFFGRSLLALCWMSGLTLAQTEGPPKSPSTNTPPIAEEAKPITDGKPLLGIGEVNANDVYVRSGASQNHYTICKLKTGDKVSVVGESGDWYEIIPPDDVFSVVSGDYVDTTDNETGMINGENVRVRAGSLLNDQKYTVQTLLSKGAVVRIIGRNPDGFLRIKPPSGATLWITRSFVTLSPDAQAALNREKTDGNTAGAIAGDSASPPSGDAKIASRQKSDLLPLPASELEMRKLLKDLDTQVRVELAKPVKDRRLGPLIEKFRTVSEQEPDDVARRYAEARVKQLNDLAEASQTVQRLKKLDETATETRQDFLAARAKMQHGIPPAPTGVDATGELRISSLYSSPTGPRRYRLVDPTVPEGRTIGYVEIPTGMNFPVDQFVNRYVGVRAAERRVQQGTVSPIPIFVLGELMLMELPEGEATSTPETPNTP